MISLSFANHMVQEQADCLAFCWDWWEHPEDTQLSWHDYEHMQEQLVRFRTTYAMLFKFACAVSTCFSMVNQVPESTSSVVSGKVIGSLHSFC